MFGKFLLRSSVARSMRGIGSDARSSVWGDTASPEGRLFTIRANQLGGRQPSHHDGHPFADESQRSRTQHYSTVNCPSTRKLGETQTLDDSLNAIRKASFILVRNETHPTTYTYRKFNFNQMQPADFIAQVNAWGQESYRFLNQTVGLSPNWDVLAVKSSAAAGATYSYAFEPVVSNPKPQLISRGGTGYRYKGYFEYQAHPNNQPIQGVFNFYEFDSSRPAAVTYRFSDDTTHFPGGRLGTDTPEGLAVLNDQARQGFFFTVMSISTSANGGVAMTFAEFGIYVQGGMLLSRLHGGGDAAGAILFP